MLGGELDGGKILGKYPQNLGDVGKYSAGRGRLIPTMPYEAPWNAVAQWLGVNEDYNLDTILPNRISFTGQLFEQKDLFAATNDDFKSCEATESPVTCKPESMLEEEEEEESTDDNTSNIGEKARTSSGAIIASTLSTLIFLLLVFGVYKMKIAGKAEHEYHSDESVESLQSLFKSTKLFDSTNLVQYIGSSDIEVDITHTYSDSDSST